MDDDFGIELRKIFTEHNARQPTNEMIAEIRRLYPDTHLAKLWIFDNEEMRDLIIHTILPATIGRWARKNEDYRGQQVLLGAQAQFIDINRKFWKLFHIVWEGHEPLFEDEREIKMDLIGHLLMSLYLADPEHWRELRRMQDEEMRRLADG